MRAEVFQVRGQWLLTVAAPATGRKLGAFEEQHFYGILFSSWALEPTQLLHDAA